jgi:hypothetical protein
MHRKAEPDHFHGELNRMPADLSVDVKAYSPSRQKTFRIRVDGRHFTKIVERDQGLEWKELQQISKGDSKTNVAKRDDKEVGSATRAAVATDLNEETSEASDLHSTTNLEMLLEHIRYRAGNNLGLTKEALSLSLRKNPRRGKQLHTKVFCQAVAVKKSRPQTLPEEVACAYSQRHGRKGWFLRTKAEKEVVSYDVRFVGLQKESGYFVSKEDALAQVGWFMSVMNSENFLPSRKERRIMSVNRWYDWFDVWMYDPTTSSSHSQSFSLDVLCKWICEEAEDVKLSIAAANRTAQKKKNNGDGSGVKGVGVVVVNASDMEMELQQLTLKLGGRILSTSVTTKLLADTAIEMLLIEWLMAMLHKDQHASLRGSQRKKALKLQNAAVLIQGVWRTRSCWQTLIQLARQVFRKAFDATTNQFYYINTVNGNTQWTCPSLVPEEVFDEPMDEWTMCEDADTHRTYYYNPAWDKYSWISEHQAATRLSRFIRKHQLKALGLQQLSFTERIQKVAKAIKFQTCTMEKYEQNPRKLCNVVNFGLLLQSQFNVDSDVHSYQHDVDHLKGLYTLAYEELGGRRDALVLILNALILAMDPLFDCTIRPVPEEAERLVEVAIALEPDLHLFKNAEDYFFKWAVILPSFLPSVIYSLPSLPSYFSSSPFLHRPSFFCPSFLLFIFLSSLFRC